ncbi:MULTISPECIES: choline ABC transporter ATP-binding protein [Donghicola]|jgi:glycine betaine/proline transport system ATP-binding protein|uniref:Trimethylamine N-oxide transport system ATP-binding protein TmoW n=1 Tax=Donghicola eburneus TaxID=393278 RepID=A0A1M4N6H3_9RHOB|nr:MULTISPECIES: choline ABC transporter ATP-binding protein [Donghicola]MCT4577978.1 choline ABC transporter ATP-binding protein [Donghicola sp.]SCM69668.1 Glycine betaine transport ATP-binding protein OpuAA [Donghicola eburneus]SFQ63476.1 glycine betaine/proline transport system ATP-binding protein [Donghicola eburneus]
MSTAVKFDNVSIVFGDKPQSALPLMDKGADRGTVQQECGQVLGVHNCSLEVGTGEILVLMGLSGSGKSTLLRAVNALNPVVRGSVLVNDGNQMVDITHADKTNLRRMRLSQIAMVFQQFGLLPWRTVRENVQLGLELGGMDKAERDSKVETQLDLVGLSQWADRKVGELSGGMQQRVGLARAFVTDAPILLMDEPFSALDPLIRAKLQDELLELQQKLNRTIIFVSHDLDEAFKIGNRIAIMEGGRIVQCGTPQEIFSKPADDYVTEFVAHMNPLGVLRAGDIMSPATSLATDQVDAGMPVGDVMQRIMGTETPLAVIKDGQIIGQITKDDILRNLVDPRSAA